MIIVDFEKTDILNCHLDLSVSLLGRWLFTILKLFLKISVSDNKYIEHKQNAIVYLPSLLL